MATVTLTTSGPDFSLLEKYLQKKAALTLLPNLELYQFGREAIVPPGSGKEVFAPRWFDASTATGSVAESAAVGTSDMSAGNYSGSLLEYPKAFKFSRFLWATKSLPMLEETTKQLVVSNAKAFESRIQDVISTASTLSDNGMLLSPTGGTEIATKDVAETSRLKARVLSTARTKLINKYNPGFTEFGGNFAGVFHGNATHDLRTNLSGGATLTLERSSMNITAPFRGNMIGDLFNIRIFESSWSAKAIHATNGMSESNSGYLNYIFAPEAFYVAPLATARPEIILESFETAKLDAARRFATLAVYQVFDAFKGDRVNRMVQIPVGATLT